MNTANEALLEALFQAGDPLAETAFSTVDYWWQFFRAKARALLAKDSRVIYHAEIQPTEKPQTVSSTWTGAPRLKPVEFRVDVPEFMRQPELRRALLFAYYQNLRMYLLRVRCVPDRSPSAQPLFSLRMPQRSLKPRVLLRW